MPNINPVDFSPYFLLTPSVYVDIYWGTGWTSGPWSGQPFSFEQYFLNVGGLAQFQVNFNIL